MIENKPCHISRSKYARVWFVCVRERKRREKNRASSTEIDAEEHKKAEWRWRRGDLVQKHTDAHIHRCLQWSLNHLILTVGFFPFLYLLFVAVTCLLLFLVFIFSSSLFSSIKSQRVCYMRNILFYPLKEWNISGNLQLVVILT